MRFATLALTLALGYAHGAAAQELTGTLKKIKERKTIVLGHRESSWPFSFVDDSGKPAGYSVDLCVKVAEAIGNHVGIANLPVKWVKVTPEDRIKAVADGTVDLEHDQHGHPLSTASGCTGSITTFVDGGSLLVAADAGVRTSADLAGKAIAVIPKTTTEGALARWLAQQGITAQVLPVHEHAEGLAAVSDGRAVAYASDRTILIGLGLAYQGTRRMVVMEDFLSYEPYGLMMRRRDPDFRLTVNRALADVYRSGDIVSIYKRWFGDWGPPSRLLGAMYLLNSVPE